MAFLLSVPLIVLGIYCIFPHPFYDPDCTFAILLCIVLLQELERKDFPSVPAFFVGALLVVPLVRQTEYGTRVSGERCRGAGGVGRTWRVAWAPGSWICIANGRDRRRAHVSNPAHSPYSWARELCALDNRIRCFPAVAAVPGYAFDIPEPSAAMVDCNVCRWNCGCRGLIGKGNRALALLSVALMSAPFAWMSIYLLLDKDSSERAERLLAVWPFLVDCFLRIRTTKRQACE